MGAVCLLATLGLSETYEPVLLQKKAARLRKETGNPHLRSKLEVDMSRSEILVTAMLRPLKMLFLSPNIFFVSLVVAVGYGYMYILYTTLPTTFVSNYGWAPKNTGLSYWGTAIGNILGMAIGGALSDRIVKKRAKHGDSRPENRLLLMIFFWPLTTVGLVLYGQTANGRVHWFVPLLGTALFGMGAMSANVSASSEVLVHIADGPRGFVSLCPGLVCGYAMLVSSDSIP